MSKLVKKPYRFSFGGNTNNAIQRKPVKLTDIKGTITLRDEDGNTTTYPDSRTAYQAYSEQYDPANPTHLQTTVQAKQTPTEVPLMKELVVDGTDPYKDKPINPIRAKIFEGYYNGHYFYPTAQNIDKYLRVYDADRNVGENYGGKAWGKVGALMGTAGIGAGTLGLLAPAETIGALNLWGAYEGGKRLISDEGVAKTKRLWDEGSYGAAVKSGLGDILDASLVYPVASRASKALTEGVEAVRQRLIGNPLIKRNISELGPQYSYTYDQVADRFSRTPKHATDLNLLTGNTNSLSSTIPETSLYSDEELAKMLNDQAESFFNSITKPQIEQYVTRGFNTEIEGLDKYSGITRRAMERVVRRRQQEQIDAIKRLRLFSSEEQQFGRHTLPPNKPIEIISEFPEEPSVAGSHFTITGENRMRKYEDLGYMKETGVHEAVSHGTDKLASNMGINQEFFPLLKRLNKNGALDSGLSKVSNTWYELRATINELKQKFIQYWTINPDGTISITEEAIAKIPEKELLDALNNVSVYGRDYANAYKTLGAEDKAEALKELRRLFLIPIIGGIVATGAVASQNNEYAKGDMV